MPPTLATIEQEPMAVCLEHSVSTVRSEGGRLRRSHLMTVGYISAVYMYTTEKFPAANSLPSSAIVVLRNVGQNYRER